MKEDPRIIEQLLGDLTQLRLRMEQMEAGRSEEAAREDEQTLRALLDAITDSVILMDIECNILTINETAAKRFGGDPSSMVGTNLRDYQPEETFKTRKPWLNEVLTSGEPRSFSDIRDGLHIESSLTPILDANNKVRQIVIFARDVTDHAMLEEALLARSQELEAFGHTISHDLRNPLSVIEGYAMTAKDAAEEGNREIEEESLDSIIKAVQRLQNLIENLLAYAKAGTPQGLATRVEPKEIVEALLEQYSSRINDAGARVDVIGELPAVRIDRMRFEQVMANLLDNALKFSAHNPKPRIEIGAKKDSGKVIIRMSDNGVGIDSQLWEMAFEPFKRFSVSESPGMGIGLSTVRRAVTGWGGEVWMESVPGRGSTCYFTAPTAD